MVDICEKPLKNKKNLCSTAHVRSVFMLMAETTENWQAIKKHVWKAINTPYAYQTENCKPCEN